MPFLNLLPRCKLACYKALAYAQASRRFMPSRPRCAAINEDEEGVISFPLVQLY